jgi:hypothetical protein
MIFLKQLDKSPYMMVEFIENKIMNECLRALKRVFKDIIDSDKSAKHYKYLQNLNFFLIVMKKLCRMQKVF